MLAIVIPYYKISFFEATLNSLAEQTDKRFTVYIGDDASPDVPTEILKLYEEKFRFVYYRFNENLGGVSLTQQWERCIELIGNEEWIMILGDDDFLGKNVVEEFYLHLANVENENISVIRFATYKIDGFGNIISDVYKNDVLETSENFLIRKYKNRVRSSLTEYIFKLNVLEEKKFKNFPLAWYSDICAFLECSDFKYIYSINSAVVYVRSSILNISSINDTATLLKKNISQRLFCNFLLDNLSKMNNKKEILKIVSNYYKNDSKNISLFLRIIKGYFQNLEIRGLFGFCTMMCKKLKNKHFLIVKK